MKDYSEKSGGLVIGTKGLVQSPVFVGSYFCQNVFRSVFVFKFQLHVPLLWLVILALLACFNLFEDRLEADEFFNW